MSLCKCWKIQAKESIGLLRRGVVSWCKEHRIVVRPANYGSHPFGKPAFGQQSRWCSGEKIAVDDREIVVTVVLIRARGVSVQLGLQKSLSLKQLASVEMLRFFAYIPPSEHAAGTPHSRPSRSQDVCS